ncbi:MAG TPA: hypothetical protein VGM88_00830 [Kofleriaceae bacterium]|jgi:hypothetical protein
MTKAIGLAALVLCACGGDDHAGGGDAAGSDAAGGPPTASSWLGVNMAGDLPWTDITHQLAPFQGGTSQTDVGFALPTGEYKISYEGNGTLTAGGIAALEGAWQTAGTEQRATLMITGTPGEFGHLLTLTTTGDVANIHIYVPGIDYDAADEFAPQLVAKLAPFRTIRFMDWEATNGSTVTDWADRAQPGQFGTSPQGVAYEDIAELIDVTGKDAWITVPQAATDAYVQQQAQMFAAKLDFDRIGAARAAQGVTAPFELVVEYSNETWNTGFTAHDTLLATANANTARYTGVYDGTYGPDWMTSNSDLMKVGQVEADRLVMIGNAFKTAMGAHADAVKPVLSGWALGPGYSDVGLRFIQANYGDPKDYVAYIAQAPYFNVDDAQTGSLDALFADANTNIQAMHATFMDFASLGADYGIAIAGYEGGQGFGGTVNQPIKHLAQHDQRMYDAYTAYLQLWKQDFGNSLFCHFTLAETPGIPETIYQYGYWGSIISIDEDTTACEPNLPTLTGTEAIADVVHHCPKYRALVEQALP